VVDSICDLCREVGIPEALVMDGKGAQNNPEVDSVVCIFVIRVHKSELENQHQNHANKVVVFLNKAYVSCILKRVLTLITGAT
jgi:hypothetical protein